MFYQNHSLALYFATQFYEKSFILDLKNIELPYCAHWARITMI